MRWYARVRPGRSEDLGRSNWGASQRSATRSLIRLAGEIPGREAGRILDRRAFRPREEASAQSSRENRGKAVRRLRG
jgi:hypothetical protein